MLLTLPYLAFLNGRPDRHRHSKSCLLVRYVQVEVPELGAADAPVAMSGGRTDPGGPVELRAYDGLLYRKPKANWLPSQLPALTSSTLFNGIDEIHGVLTHIAKRGYESSMPGALPKLPVKIARTTHTFIPTEAQIGQSFAIGHGFTIDDSHVALAKQLEDKAMERYGRYVLIDGTVWIQSQELVYMAKPWDGVRALIGGHRQLPDDPAYTSRYAPYGDPEVRFFNVSSAQSAADFAGVDLQEVPMVNVRDGSFVSDDFDASELERCARNVAAEMKAFLWSFNDGGRLLQNSLEALLAEPNPASDALADTLSSVSNLARNSPDLSEAVKFTPPVIDRFVERWGDRSIGPLVPGARVNTPF